MRHTHPLHGLEGMHAIDQRLEDVQKAVSQRLGREVSEEELLPAKDVEELMKTGEAAKHFDSLLQILSRVPHDTKSLPDAHMREVVRSKVCVLNREYEERFLEEPSGSERRCANSYRSACFASRIHCNGMVQKNFGLKEFYLPEEFDAISSGGMDLPKDPRPCLLCLRESICRDFFAIRCDQSTVPGLTGVASIGNIVGPGEYPADAVVVSDPRRYEGLVEPIVVPHLDDYTIYRGESGKVCVEQLIPTPQEPANGVGDPFFFF